MTRNEALAAGPDRLTPWFGTCYGVDVSGEQVIAVRGARSRGRLQYSRVDLQDPATRADMQRRRAVVVACLLERESLTRWLEAPFNSPAKAEKIFPSLLDVQLPFPIEECVYAFIRADRVRGQNTRALAVVARYAAVEARLAALKACSLDPVLLDQEALVLWTQSLREVPPETVGAKAAGVARVVAYMGADRFTLAVGSRRDFLAAHTMRQPRADETARFLRATLPGSPSGVRWFWAGPGVADNAAILTFQAELTARWPATFAAHEDPAAFLARGLATRALSPGPYRCNLRAGPYTHPRMHQAGVARFARSAVLCLMAGLLLAGVSLGWRVHAERRAARLQARIAALASGISAMAKPPRGTEVLMAQRAMDRRAPEMAPLLRAFEPSATVVLKGILDAASANALACESIVLSGKSISADGVADNWKQCEQFSAALARLGLRHTLERRGSTSEGGVLFSIKPVAARAHAVERP